MYWKVLILEKKDNYSLAMKEDGSIVRIKNKAGISEGDSIYIVEEDLFVKEDSKKFVAVPISGEKKAKAKNSNMKKSTLQKITSVVAAIAIFAMVLSVPQFAEKAYATVSFDGQKSIELKLNKDNKIMAAKSYDKTFSLEELKALKGKDLSEILTILKGFETEDQSILVATALMKDEDDIELSAKLKDLLQNYNTVFLEGNKNDVKAAHRAKKSLGIYILEKAEDDDALEDLLDDVSPKDLKKFVKKYNSRVELLAKDNDSSDNEDHKKSDSLGGKNDSKDDSSDDVVDKSEDGEDGDNQDDSDNVDNGDNQENQANQDEGDNSGSEEE